MKPQLPLFDPPPIEPVDDAALTALGRALPSRLHLGTSSWTFPGWSGLVYKGAPTKNDLIERGLRAYCRHPLFRTVSVDRSYYAPLQLSEWEAYRREIPPGFKMSAKMGALVTRRVNLPKVGEHQSTPNPLYLDVATASEFVRTFKEGLGDAAGPILIQFPPMDVPDSARFCVELAPFLRALPSDVRYAIEIRNRELLTPRYVRTLKDCGVAHTFTYWSQMPPLEVQLGIPDLVDAPFAMARLNLAPGERYGERREAFAPFDRIVVPQPKMRQEVIRLWRRIAERDLDLFVIVNNKAEGSAPLTLRAIAEEMSHSPGS